MAESPTPSLPVTVTSHDLSGDVPVTVTDVSRIIAMDLSGSLAATVAGLGFAGGLVGRDISTTFPEARELPLVTAGGHSVNAEAVIALAPTLVITDGSIGPADVVQQLRDVGITVVFVERSTSFAGAVAQARQVAQALGVPETGELLATRIQDDVQRVTAEVARLAPAAASDRVRMEKIEEHPDRVAQLAKVQAHQAEAIQQIRLREREAIERFKQQYGIDPTRSSFFTYEGDDGAPPPEPGGGAF